LEKEDLKNILYENDTDKIKDFVLENGKEGKVFCPIEFIKEDNKNE